MQTSYSHGAGRVPGWQRHALALAVASVCVAVHAENDTAGQLAEVTVRDRAEEPLPEASGRLTTAVQQQLRAATDDTARLLQSVPGVALFGAGGFSSLPALHGLAGDRVRIQVDGMDPIAACPNHMNPALSYLAPSQVGSMAVYAGLVPVSLGGDSIAGTVAVATPTPAFALPGDGLRNQGEVGVQYRSNGNVRSAQASASVASDTFSLGYSGSYAESGNYRAGGPFKTGIATGRPGHELPLDEVGSTAYQVSNHLVSLAWKHDAHVLEAKVSTQDAPYSLFPNQRMDMTGNEQLRASLRYQGRFDWGKLEASAYREAVDHAMDFGPDKMLNYGTVTGSNSVVYPVDGMPMFTHAVTTGLNVQGEFAVNDRDLLRVGGLWQTYRLNDWWPSSPDCGVGNCTGGMAPYTFWNIRDGQRDRKALFGEWDARWNPQWDSQLGVRTEHVTSNTGPAQGYNTGMMYANASLGTLAQFNALDRKRTDRNWDLTAVARYQPSDAQTLQFGYAQKMRSPNLYERYSWSTNAMAMEMNNFLGDGNGYVGNPSLQPEVAHTLSATAGWHDPAGSWAFQATPYYSRVSDYIDAVRLPSSVSMGVSDNNATRTAGFVKLQYANQSARLYGLDLNGHADLGRGALGQWRLLGVLNYTNGVNRDTGSALYNVMPLNLRLTLNQRLGGWDNAIEWVAVRGKTDGSDARNEIRTPGYALFNVRTSHTWGQVRVDLGVENLFDKLYYLPLGGAYTGQGATMAFNREVGAIGASGGTASAWGTAVPGAGRTLYAGVTVKF